MQRIREEYAARDNAACESRYDEEIPIPAIS